MSSSSKQEDDSLNAAFALYKKYIHDSKNSFQGGNDDDLRSILEQLKDQVPNSLPLDKLTTKRALTPLFISAVSFLLAEKAVNAFMENPFNDKGMEQVEEHCGTCLAYFCSNAAAWVLGANFARVSKKLNAAQIAAWYEHAADTADACRTAGIALMESTNIDASTKEWVEVLLLNHAAGVESFEKMAEAASVASNDVPEAARTSSGDVSKGSSKSSSSSGKGHRKTDTSLSLTTGDDPWSCSSVEATARFMGAMLPSIAGDHATALVSLRRFPITHRLSSAMWTGENETAEQIATNSDGSKCSSESLSTMLANQTEPSSYKREGGLLPSTLYQSLCQVFGADAPYWKESDSANREYFSFWGDLPKEGEPPRNLVEDAVVNYLLPLVRRQLSADQATQICGYEWWVVSNPSDDDFGTKLHFEHDNALKDLYQKNIKPFLSSVLYLSGHTPTSGASIVLDQTRESTEDAEYGYRNSPTENSLLVFSGDLLSGTLPDNSKPLPDQVGPALETKQDDTPRAPDKEQPPPAILVPKAPPTTTLHHKLTSAPPKSCSRPSPKASSSTLLIFGRFKLMSLR